MKKVILLLAIVFTVLSGLLASEIMPNFTKGVVFTLNPPLASLEKIEDNYFSFFMTREFQTDSEPISVMTSSIERGQPGFSPLLSIVLKKGTAPISRKSIDTIFLFKTGPAMESWGLDLTPQNVIAVRGEGITYTISFLWNGELESLIDNKIQSAMQNFSFWFLLVSVIMDLTYTLMSENFNLRQSMSSVKTFFKKS